MSSELASFGRYNPLIGNPTERPTGRGAQNKAKVKVGHDGLLLPEFTGAFGTTMETPVSDTLNWMNRFISCNPQSQYGEPFKPRSLSFEATSELKISGVEARKFGQLVVTRVVDSSYNSILSFNRSAIAPMTVYGGHELLYRDDGTRTEQSVQPDIQPIVQNILKDLGYGNPELFAADAVPLQEARRTAA